MRTGDKILAATTGRRCRWLLFAGVAGAAVIAGLRGRRDPLGRREVARALAWPQDAGGEIQTCLAVIRGHCELARSNGRGDERLPQRMDLAIEAVDEAAARVRRLSAGRPGTAQLAPMP